MGQRGWGNTGDRAGQVSTGTNPSPSQSHQCGSCRALVDELEWEIAQVDPRKTIQMGSFRINPDGSQSVVEVRPLPVSLPLVSPLTPA
uniref:DUF3456 domain-containing protein n=1 Tax=Junco hyemalis TaxID=40217 RepID=A0A8C5JL70_JUNHY